MRSKSDDWSRGVGGERYQLREISCVAREIHRAVLALVRSCNASERLAESLCCLPKFEAPAGLSYDNVFRVAIVHFMDRFNFCLGGVKRSCIHFVTPNGQIIPFDTYNLFYRDGRIDGIRARMRAEANA